MSRTWKIVLIVLGCCLLGTLAMCGGAYWWFQANKDQLRAEGMEVQAEAERFAAGHHDVECVEHSLGKLDACAKEGGFGIKCGALVNTFLGTCLEKSKQTPDLCTGVPAGESIIDIATWSVGQCAAKGRADDQACGRLMQVVQRECEKRAH